MNQEPAYLSLHKRGELDPLIADSRQALADCRLCPRQCGVNRLAGETGVCGIGEKIVVASYAPHFGEESPLVGQGGSGTIFVAGCSLGCVFCQNYDISHSNNGMALDAGQLAAIMVSLQKQGCHNINFVTPSHVVPQILAALPPAIAKGLSVPLVYNSSGYDRGETLQMLAGVVDIYLPDFKFWQTETAARYAGAPDYPDRARAAIREMYHQVGDLRIGTDGIATRGLLVRHLVMPGALAETGEIVKFLAGLSVNTYVNIMEQYRPEGKAGDFAEISRPLEHAEYEKALETAQQAGLTRLDEKDFIAMLRQLGIV
jgi:putative pyruvate formate lyase activating enzyme